MAADITSFSKNNAIAETLTRIRSFCDKVGIFEGLAVEHVNRRD